MARPFVAVVGRPNVGKSTFFNKIARDRIAIVEDTPGVTRDRVTADVEWQNHWFTLIDTGGIDPKSTDPLRIQMRKQAGLAIDMADVILFFVDGRDGLTADDEDVANLLRKAKAPILVVVNKSDTVKLADNRFDFYGLGFGDPIAISSTNLMNLGDLLDEIIARLPPADPEPEDAEAPVKVAIVGRPNVGKSTLTNRLLGEERVMVSDIPGTTRDAVDAPLQLGDRRYTLIDTAGMRRRRAIEENSLERFSVVRALAAIRRCDVALLLIDAEVGVTEQDTKIAGVIHDEGKACAIIVNKWDAVEKDTGTLEQTTMKIRDGLKFLGYAPILFVSALTGQRVQKVMALVDNVYIQSTRRITTGVLNDVLSDAMLSNPPPLSHGHRLKIYYATQHGVQPPTFILFVNDENLMHFAYERYLENQFRKAFGFEGTPLKFHLRPRNKENS